MLQHKHVRVHYPEKSDMKAGKWIQVCFFALENLSFPHDEPISGVGHRLRDSRSLEALCSFVASKLETGALLSGLIKSKNGKRQNDCHHLENLSGAPRHLLDFTIKPLQ